MFFQGILKRALICNSDNSDIEMPDAFVIVFAHQVADRNFAFCFAFLQFDVCFFTFASIAPSCSCFTESTHYSDGPLL